MGVFACLFVRRRPQKVSDYAQLIGREVTSCHFKDCQARLHTFDTKSEEYNFKKRVVLNIDYGRERGSEQGFVIRGNLIGERLRLCKRQGGGGERSDSWLHKNLQPGLFTLFPASALSDY